MTRVTTSEEFGASLEAQGTALAFEIPTTSEGHARFGQWACWPSSIVDGVDRAATQLRRYPSRALIDSDAQVDVTRLPSDRFSQALGAMINASVVSPDERQATGLPNFTSGDVQWGTCDEAEIGFLRAFRALRFFNVLRIPKPNIWGKQDNGARIVVDGVGAPIFLQKAAGNPTALALRDISINNVPHPAGSIVGLGFGHGVGYAVSRSGVYAIPSSEVRTVGYGRLSSFVVPADQRGRYIQLKYPGLLLPHDPLALRHLTVERIRKSAARAARIVCASYDVYSLFVRSDQEPASSITLL